MVGGKLLDTNGSYSRTIAAYDPEANRFHCVGELVTGRARATCCEWDGKLVVAGGYSNADLSSVEVFDPATCTTTQLPPMLKERSDFYMSACDEGLLVIDDWITSKENVEYYDARTSKWEKRRQLDLRTHFVLGIACLSSDVVLKALRRDFEIDHNVAQTMYLK